jgi:hypothetical protein
MKIPDHGESGFENYEMNTRNWVPLIVIHNTNYGAKEKHDGCCGKCM